MILNPRHNFQACQAVHEADAVITLTFESLVNSMIVWGPKVTTVDWSAKPNSVNFASNRLMKEGQTL